MTGRYFGADHFSGCEIVFQCSLYICIFLVIYDDVFVAVVACAFCLINCFSLGMPVNHLFICLF